LVGFLKAALGVVLFRSPAVYPTTETYSKILETFGGKPSNWQQKKSNWLKRFFPKTKTQSIDAAVVLLERKKLKKCCRHCESSPNKEEQLA
jgi:hypothetical protein